MTVKSYIANLTKKKNSINSGQIFGLEILDIHSVKTTAILKKKIIIIRKIFIDFKVKYLLIL